MKGKTYQMPVSSWDEYGCRVMVVTHEMEIGDIELKETRQDTMSLMQYICAGIVEIIRFLTVRPSSNHNNNNNNNNNNNYNNNNLFSTSPAQQPQSTNPALSLSPASLPSLPRASGNGQGNGQIGHSAGGQGTVVFSEPFVVLVQRYIVAICNCVDLFQVDESRTKQQVCI